MKCTRICIIANRVQKYAGAPKDPNARRKPGESETLSGETIRDDESVRPPAGAAASELEGGRKSEPHIHPLPPLPLAQARSEPTDLHHPNHNQNSRATPAGEAAALRTAPGAENGDRSDQPTTSRNKENSQSRSLLEGLSVITEVLPGVGAAAPRNTGEPGELRGTPQTEDEATVPNLVPPRTSKRLRSADPYKPRGDEDGPDGGSNVAQSGYSNGHSYTPPKAPLLPPPPPPLAGRLDGAPKPAMHAAHSYHNVNGGAGGSPNSDAASNPKTERSEGKSDLPMSLRIANLALFASSSDKASNLTSNSYSHLPPAAAPTPCVAFSFLFLFPFNTFCTSRCFKTPFIIKFIAN